MICKNCNSIKFISLYMKYRDLCNADVPHLGLNMSDCIPELNNGIGSGESNFNVCVQCGTIHEWQSLTDTQLKHLFDDECQDDSDVDCPLTQPIAEIGVIDQIVIPTDLNNGFTKLDCGIVLTNGVELTSTMYVLTDYLNIACKNYSVEISKLNRIGDLPFQIADLMPGSTVDDIQGANVPTVVVYIRKPMASMEETLVTAVLLREDGIKVVPVSLGGGPLKVLVSDVVTFNAPLEHVVSTMLSEAFL